MKAVRLERLVGSVGQTGAGHRNKEKKTEDNESKLSGSKLSNKQGSSVDESDDEEEVKLTKKEKRKIVFLTETPRPWLNPFYNK